MKHIYLIVLPINVSFIFYADRKLKKNSITLFSFISYICTLNNINNYLRKLSIIFFMIVPASLILANLDLLLTDTAASSSARIM